MLLFLGFGTTSAVRASFIQFNGSFFGTSGSTAGYRSALFQVTVQPICVQDAETACSDPFTALRTAMLPLPSLFTPPSPGRISLRLATRE